MDSVTLGQDCSSNHTEGKECLCNGLPTQQCNIAISYNNNTPMGVWVELLHNLEIPRGGEGLSLAGGTALLVV